MISDKTASLGAKSPLGLLSLFIVFIDGIAALLLYGTSSLSELNQTILILFIALFPIVVILSFVWLISNHREKLLWPSDFSNDEAFLSVIRLNRNTGINIDSHELIKELVVREIQFRENVTVKRDAKISSALTLDGVFSKEGKIYGLVIVIITNQEDIRSISELEQGIVNIGSAKYPRHFCLQTAIVIKEKTQTLKSLCARIQSPNNSNIIRQYYCSSDLYANS